MSGWDHCLEFLVEKFLAGNFTHNNVYLSFVSHFHADVLMLSVPSSPLLPLSAPTLTPPLSCLGRHLPAPLSHPHPAKGPARWLWSIHSSLSLVPGRPRSCMTMTPTTAASFPCWLMRYSWIFGFTTHTHVDRKNETISDITNRKWWNDCVLDIALRTFSLSLS